MYRVLFTKAAEKEYKFLHHTNANIFRRVRVAIHAIAEDPSIGKPLKFGLKGKLSHRVGMYRIIYSVEHRVLTVYILDIGHRREVYG